MYEVDIWEIFSIQNGIIVTNTIRLGQNNPVFFFTCELATTIPRLLLESKGRFVSHHHSKAYFELESDADIFENKLKKHAVFLKISTSNEYFEQNEERGIAIGINHIQQIGER